MKSTRHHEVKDKIIELRKSGASYRDIQTKLKCSKSTINFHCKNLGLLDIGLKPQTITNEIVDKINEATKTLTVNETFKKVGVARSTVIKYMDKKDLYPTQETKDKVVEFKKTHTTKETAKEFNISTSSVTRYNKK